MSVNIDLKNNVALVTGAAGGIGRAVVEILIKSGANIIAEDINEAVYALLHFRDSWNC